jgi:hypothetical protein
VMVMVKGTVTVTVMVLGLVLGLVTVLMRTLASASNPRCSGMRITYGRCSGTPTAGSKEGTTRRYTSHAW